MKRSRRRPMFFWLAFIVALALIPTAAYAIAVPDDLIIVAVTGYTGVLEDDDLLIVVHYDID